jgi:hypothetical protein
MSSDILVGKINLPVYLIDGNMGIKYPLILFTNKGHELPGLAILAL